MLSRVKKIGGCRIVCLHLLLICGQRVGVILGRSISGASRFFVLGLIGCLAFFCANRYYIQTFIIYNYHQYPLINSHKNKVNKN